MPQTILTEAEAIRHSKIPRGEFPACDVADIFQVERTERRKTFGEAFFDAIEADVVDYASATEFAKGTVYSPDDVVSYRGAYYTATAGTTSEPSDRTNWDLAPKMTDPDFQDLWCFFMARYLSLLVIRDTIQPQTNQLTGAGVININGENFSQAKPETVVTSFHYIDAQVRRTYDNMVAWITEKDTASPGGKWSTFLGVTDADEECRNDSFKYPTECPGSSGINREKMNSGWEVA
jgi:hypothetical protein